MTRFQRDAPHTFADLAESDLGRRNLLSLGGAGLLALAVSGCGGDSTVKTSAALAQLDRDDDLVLSVKDARKRLVDGNARFVAGTPGYPDQTRIRRKKVGGDGQKPFVTVLSCVDSRVPPELVFDQGLGDLFVVRSAGQVLDKAVLGSIQFGVAEFQTPLLVVLGHTKCGAVKATVEAIEKKSGPSGTDIDSLVGAITPAVIEAEEAGAKEKDLVTVAIANNTERVVERLSTSKLLSLAVKSRKLKILGAIYDIDTGEVSFD